MNSLTSYKTVLLPSLISKTNYRQRCKIESLKKTILTSYQPIEYISQQIYKNKDAELEANGFKIVRNVFKNTKELDLIHELSDMYDYNMCEFVDKDEIMKPHILPILSNKDFIQEYTNVFGNPFLWQKTTIHRKKRNSSISAFDKECITAEHMDITETPNSRLTITAYIAITNQMNNQDSKLLVYPKSHLYDIRIPMDNFDYVSSLLYKSNSTLFCEINTIVEHHPELEWVRECLYHLIVLNIPEYKILKSTFLLMLFNPEIFKIQPQEIRLQQGDVLFFLSNLLHGSTQHKNESSSRVSLAVRGGYPYYEPSCLISKNIKHQKILKENHFLFSGTPEMISTIQYSDLHKYDDIIYEL